MAETDLKIKDAPLSTNISGNVRMAGSDGSGKPVAISLLQVYNFVNSILNSDGYFAPKTDIPSNVSSLINDSGYITSAALTPYLKKTELPTNVSVFTNDAGYLVKKDLAPYALTANVPTKVSQLVNDSKYVVQSAADAISEEVASIKKDIEAIKENTDKLGNVEALSVNMMSLPKVCGYDYVIMANAAPAQTPNFVGQIYIDTTNAKVYMAVNVTNASGYVVLN